MSLKRLKHWWLWVMWRSTTLAVRFFESRMASPPLYRIIAGIPFQNRSEADEFTAYCIRRTFSMIGLRLSPLVLIGANSEDYEMAIGPYTFQLVRYSVIRGMNYLVSLEMRDMPLSSPAIPSLPMTPEDPTRRDS